MNILSENTPEYPEEFEQAMKVFFGLNEQDHLSKIGIPPTKNLSFTVSKLFTAIISGKMIDSQDIDNPSWDYIENDRKTLKKDNIFPNALVKELDDVYFNIMLAVKKHLIDKKSLMSHRPIELNPDQYSIYAFVIDRFYKAMNTTISDKLITTHDRAIDLLS